MKIDRTTLIAVGFAAVLFGNCIAQFFLTKLAVKLGNLVLAAGAGALLMTAVFLFIWWMELWVKKIRRERATTTTSKSSLSDEPERRY